MERKENQDDVKKRKFMTFLNDHDGFTSKDFLLAGSFVSYILFWAIGLVRDLMGIPVGESYIELLEQMRYIVFTIVTGVFAVSGVNMGIEAYKNKNKNR